MDPLAIEGVRLEFDSLMRLQYLGGAMRAGHGRTMTAFPGGFVHRQRGRGLEVNDVRPWLFGDDIRHIDRNATARTGIQHVRTFRDERDRSLLLLADFRPSMLFGTRRAFRSVAAGECLALLGWNATSLGIRVATLTAGAEPMSAPPGRGVRHMSRILGLWTRAHAAALADPRATDAPLAASLEASARQVPSGAIIVVATALDHAGDEFDGAVRWLARRNDLRFAIIRDAFERAPPRGAYRFVADGRPDGVIEIGRDYVSRVENRCAHLRGLGASAIVVDSDLDHEQAADALEALDV
jgi:uncharacterized protein (DUF58 family)